MSLIHRIEHNFISYFHSFVYPFTQKDWPWKMWIFAFLSYIPIVNFIIARGWRLEFIHRLGWGYQRPLPKPTDLVKFFLNGALLWLITFVLLLVPVVIVSQLGLGGFRDFLKDLAYLFTLVWDTVFGDRTMKDLGPALLTFLKTELIHSFWVLIIENFYLLLFYPIYRIGTVRFALTKRLFSSHGAFLKNIQFLFRNFVEVVMMVFFFPLLKWTMIGLVDWLLTMTVIGIPLIPIVTVYMYYWSSGYEYGHLAHLMVQQEQMAVPAYAEIYVTSETGH